MPSVDEELSALTYRQLQVKCKDEDVKASGKREDLLKRLHEKQELHRLKTEVKENKHPTTPRQTKPSFPIDHLACPITKKLPLDAVTAEDGYVYERKAIQNHIEKSQPLVGAQPMFGFETVTSPVTKKHMGTRLVPALAHERQVHSLVDSGAISGEAVSMIAKKVDYLKKAKAGDPDAMYKVGRFHTTGQLGFQKDQSQAYDWLLKAHRAGSVSATARLGEAHCNWQSVQHGLREGHSFKQQGMIYYAMAVGGGSDWAAYKLGLILASGLHGFQTNEAEAEILLAKAVSGQCSVKTMNEATLKDAQEQLQQLKKRVQGSFPTNLNGVKFYGV